MRRLAIALFLASMLASCGTKQSSADPPASDPPFLGTDGGFGSIADGGKLQECAEETKDIFVISEENSLYSFHPPTLAFKSIGVLSCPTGGAKPTSMAVDRQGIAWVRHDDGSIWKVNTRNVDCQGTTFVAPADGNPFYQFGMGFSTSSKGGSNEELFLSDSTGKTGLGKLNTTSLKLSFVGSFTGSLAGKTAELTGTGDGKLYGFFTEPATVAEISKGTGDIINPKEMTNTFAGDGWAFSFYAGDFYIYTHTPTGSGPPRGNGGSDVTRYRPKDGSIEVVKPKIGFKIVGAGVSTCAPTEGPK